MPIGNMFIVAYFIKNSATFHAFQRTQSNEI